MKCRKRHCIKIPFIVLRELRCLCLKHHVPGKTVVDREHDAVSRYLVFRYNLKKPYLLSANAVELRI